MNTLWMHKGRFTGNHHHQDRNCERKVLLCISFFWHSPCSNLLSESPLRI